MQEKDFYQQILGLQSLWYVSEVKLDTKRAEPMLNLVGAKASEFLKKQRRFTGWCCVFVKSCPQP